MKIIIMSDSHGNIANLNHVLGFAKKIKAAAIIHCGDWDNVLAVETVLNSGIPVYAVLGNADIDPKITENLRLKTKKFNEKFLEVEISGRKIGIIHSIKSLVFSIEYLDILFCGHWHRQKETTISGVRVINPGALENNISFAVYETATNKIV